MRVIVAMALVLFSVSGLVSPSAGSSNTWDGHTTMLVMQPCCCNGTEAGMDSEQAGDRVHQACCCTVEPAPARVPPAPKGVTTEATPDGSRAPQPVLVAELGSALPRLYEAALGSDVRLPGPAPTRGLVAQKILLLL